MFIHELADSIVAVTYVTWKQPLVTRTRNSMRPCSPSLCASSKRPTFRRMGLCDVFP
jgi:hypothetical protein